MSFSDLLKKSVLEGFINADITTAHILMVLGVTLLLAGYVYIIYRLHNRNAFYNTEFNMALAVLPVVTAGVVLALQSSLVISLGMVGALSIVRFRTAVKDALDLVFLFWAISVGLICGAGLFALALIVSLVVSVLILFLSLIKQSATPMLLSLCAENEAAAKELEKAAADSCRAFQVKSRSVNGRGVEIVAEVRVEDAAALLSACMATEGCSNASLFTREGAVVRG